MSIQIKRVYERPSRSDGRRVLVDRLWPRGLKKDQARVDLWLRDVAPSGELRKWFAHEPAKWQEFRKRYRQELQEHADALAKILDLAKGKVTLLYSARDADHNNALALKEVLEKGSKP